MAYVQFPTRIFKAGLTPCFAPGLRHRNGMAALFNLFPEKSVEWPLYPEITNYSGKYFA
jgi:hypothetical protein